MSFILNMNQQITPKVLKVIHPTVGLLYWTGSILLPDREDAYELTTPELIEAAERARDSYAQVTIGIGGPKQFTFAVIES